MSHSADVKRVVLTGGPGAGKSSISRHIAEAYPDRIVRVPEAATQVYDALQTRWDRLDATGRREVQRRIYELQVEQEDRAAALHPGKTLLLDRGTIDGADYWPDGSDAYWSAMGSSLVNEMARYNLVIWLETAASLGLYDGDASNLRRFEDAPTAVASGKRLLHLWGGHRQLERVGAFARLEDKIIAVETILGITAG
jgi:predicted ATPase